jgi:hypothetical protein
MMYNTKFISAVSFLSGAQVNAVQVNSVPTAIAGRGRKNPAKLRSRRKQQTQRPGVGETTNLLAQFVDQTKSRGIREFWVDLKDQSSKLIDQSSKLIDQSSKWIDQSSKQCWDLFDQSINRAFNYRTLQRLAVRRAFIEKRHVLKFYKKVMTTKFDNMNQVDLKTWFQNERVSMDKKRKGCIH